MSKYLRHAALVALVVVMAAHGKWLTSGAAAQNAAQAQGREQAGELPVFEVDKSWPKVPPQYKLGDVSSINSDSQGNIYVIHRPRTLKDPDFAKAAPPVLVFDPMEISCGPGAVTDRATSGRSASTASTSIPRISCGSAASIVRTMASRG